MQAHIQKWGNSLGLRIPSKLAKQLQLHPGTPVTLEIEDNRIIIKAPKYNLESLLKDVTKENQHHPILDDEPHGNEDAPILTR